MQTQLDLQMHENGFFGVDLRKHLKWQKGDKRKHTQHKQIKDET